MKRLKKVFIVISMFFLSVLVFTNIFQANDDELITFNYYEKLVDLDLINLHVEDMPESQTFKKGITFMHINKPKSPNYTFNYWAYYVDGIEYMLQVGDQFFNDTDFYAIWTPTLRGIYYELDGGINHPLNPHYFYGFETVNLKEPTKEGYEFLGFYNNENFTGDIITNFKDKDKTTTLYAKWKKLPTVSDLKVDLNNEFNSNINIDEFNDFNILFTNLDETNEISSNIREVLEVLINNIDSGTINVNDNLFNLEFFNIDDIVLEILGGVNLGEFLDFGDSLNIFYELDVIYKSHNLNFTGKFNLNVNVITYYEVETLGDFLFILSKPKVKDIVIVEDITLNSNIDINREVNINVLNSVLNLNTFEILFSETNSEAYYEIVGVFQDGVITIDNISGHFDIEGLINTNATVNILNSASNTVNIKGYWSYLNIKDNSGKTVINAIVDEVSVELSSKVDIIEDTNINVLTVKGDSTVNAFDNVSVNRLNIKEDGIVVINDEVEFIELDNENNGLYYGEATKYTVRFEYDLDFTDVLVNSGNLVESLVLSKTGYTLNGWLLNDNLFDFSIKIKDDYTLIADFTLNDFNINITGYSESVIYGTEVVLTGSNDSVVGTSTYEWYKDSLLVSETNDLTLTEVAESGLYTLFVTVTDGIYTKTLNKQINITITPEEVLVTPTGTIVKTYGSLDPSYSYTLSKDIDVTGNLTREPGEDAGLYEFNVDNLTASSNYKLVVDKTISFSIQKVSGTLTSNFTDVNGYMNVEIDYTDNSLLIYTPSHFDEDFLNVFASSYNQEGKFEVNFEDIDLSEGASTFIVQVTVTGVNILQINEYVVFKFKSVILQGSNTLYTVEDAMTASRSANNIIILYNTSFAEYDVAINVYNTNVHLLKNKVYMILPEGGPDELGKYYEKIDKKISGAPKVDRNNYVVRLNVPANITIDIVGRLIVNGIRGTARTAYQGFVSGSSYSILNLSEGSKVNVNYGAKLMVAGFITGEGLIEAFSGSFIEDSMFVESFRGGTDTYNVFEYAFPFYQFSIANIEVDVKINSGSTYDVQVSLYMSNGFVDANLLVVAPAVEGSKALIQLESGYVMKKYNLSNGETLIELYDGVASLNETSMRAGNFTISSIGIDMSFNGRWKFTVKENSELKINSYMLLFPGSSITVEEDATLIVNEGARLTVFNPYEFIEDDKIYNKYPNDDILKYYRTEIAYSYDAYTKALLNIDGTLIVNSGAEIAGIINEGVNSTIDINEGAITEYNIKYILGSTYAYVLERTVKLWTIEEYYLSVTADPVIGFKPKEDEEEMPFESTIKTYITDQYGNLVNGVLSYVIEVVEVVKDEEGNVISKTYTGNIVDSGNFNTEDGIGTFIFITDVYNAYEVRITYLDVTVSQMLYVGEESSPFLYSEDEEGNLNFEHEPFGYSMIKAIEGTTYGTLRLIKDQDGIYYIQIVEEGNSTTALNNVELYAIDYLANQGVIDAMFDINGNPHTIKERIAPKEFIDSLGRDQLAYILTKNKDYASINDSSSLFNYYVATFDKPENQNHAKLLITPRGEASGVEFVAPFLDPINYQDNLWWLDEALNYESVNETVRNVFNIFEMLVQVWDGNNWVTQASIQPKTYFDEELLVYLDLSNLNTSDLKVRLLFPSMMNYKINNISIDYSSNVEMIVSKLDLVEATLNNELDILDLVNNVDNNYVYLDYKDSARLGFTSIPLLEGYERFIGVNATGYIYTKKTTINHELKEEIEGKSFEEIIQIIINSNDENLTNYIEEVTQLYYLLLHLGSLEYEEIVYAIFSLVNEL